MTKHSRRNRTLRREKDRANQRMPRPGVVAKITSKMRTSARFFWPATVTIIGLVSAYVTIFGYVAPKVSAQPSAIMDPRDATATVFSVTNESAFALHNVVISCRFVNFYVRYYKPGYVAIRKRVGDEKKTPQIGDIHEIAPIDGFYPTIPSMRSGTMKVPISMPEEEDLDIELVVEYRPSWYPFRRQEIFRFVTKAGADRQIHWLPRPVPAPDPYAPGPAKS